MLPELVRRADAGQHQELRRDERARGQDHLRLGERPLLARARLVVDDADRAAVLDQDLPHRRVEPHRQPRVALERGDEGVGRAAALPAPVHELVEADAPLPRPVEVVVVGLAHRLDALHEPARDVVDVAGIGDQQRPLRPVPLVVEPVVALHAAEVRQHIVPGPARIVVVAAQQLVPLVVVGRPAAHVDLRVHRRAAAQHVALRYVVHAAVQMLLRHRLVVPHELAAVDHLEDAGRHVEQRVPVRVPGLQQQHPGATVPHQPRRRDAAGRPAADDDVVVPLAHSIRPAFRRATTCYGPNL